MNERITELMIDAGKTIPGEKHIDADFCNKFAELIVKECAVVAGKFVYDNKYNEEGISEFLLKEEIKEHFGVGE